MCVFCACVHARASTCVRECVRACMRDVLAIYDNNISPRFIMIIIKIINIYFIQVRHTNDFPSTGTRPTLSEGRRCRLSNNRPSPPLAIHSLRGQCTNGNNDHLLVAYMRVVFKAEPVMASCTQYHVESL